MRGDSSEAAPWRGASLATGTRSAVPLSWNSLPCAAPLLSLSSGHLSAADPEQDGRGSVTLLDQSWEHSPQATQFFFFLPLCAKRTDSAATKIVLGSRNLRTMRINCACLFVSIALF